MVRRFRLPRVNLNPFRTEKDELVDRLNDAIRNNNPEDAKLYYEQLRERGFCA